VTSDLFKTEAEMVETWLRREFKAANHRGDWLVYPETAGWDLLIAHKDGYQVGVEAKLSLNAKVLDQALTGQHSTYGRDGPDYRAVLVPEGKIQLHLGHIAEAIGIRVLTVHKPSRGVSYGLSLPDESSSYSRWPNWMPSERCLLPDYVPDVAAGMSAPVQLTDWKIRAIKLMLVLERRGTVTRADMKAIGISPTRWCDHHLGFLDPGPGRNYVRGKATPDLKAQHPVNWAQIEADMPKWLAALKIEI
jgi:hypothetical protein